MRIVVTGGRNFTDRERVYRVLDRLYRTRTVTFVVHGAASGADRLAGEWAALRGCPVIGYPADWKTHGKAAGPIRNQQMIDLRPGLVVAFPGGRGTADVARRARKAGIEVMEVGDHDRS